MESATEHQGRILLVDDESAILRTFRYCLEDEGYSVATANSAAQAQVEKTQVEHLALQQRFGLGGAVGGGDGIAFVFKAITEGTQDLSLIHI